MNTTAYAAQRCTKVYENQELTRLLASPPTYCLRRVEQASVPASVPDGAREMIEIELPSDLSLLPEVTAYLTRRAARFGVINCHDGSLALALGEALANAIKHGNNCDRAKMVRVRAEISTRAARFTISDEGEGFDLVALAWGCPADWRVAGRGIKRMRQCVDVVRYNVRGNVVTLVKCPPVAAHSRRRQAAH